MVGRTYNTTAGGTSLYHPSLSGVRILGVWKEGTEYNRIAPPGSPVGIEFVYIANRIVFDSNIPFINGEKIFILYEN